MPVINLTDHIVAASGTWTDPKQDRNIFDFAVNDTMSPSRLLLRWPGDFVAIAGPLAVRVTVQAENMTVPLALVCNFAPDESGGRGFGSAETLADVVQVTKKHSAQEGAVGEIELDRFRKGRALGLQASTIYSYTLDIPAGQAWPFNLSEQLEMLQLRHLGGLRGERLGNNLGFRVLIEPAFSLAKLVPVTSGADLPCDFAVADHPDTASFFPAACEPCDGSVIGLPPTGTVALVTPPADGGCVRTRFFNGMFITREDLETEQRYHRLKSKLHNRAAGAGVVWGLNVGRRGSSVCVLPGYGVDCCGNDLTLTTTYEVEVAALLADPMAAAACARQRTPHCMHLLLEYVECPSEPRPVHGDPCAPEAGRCEMSRIRESVRLRLVPARDYKASIKSRPIARFLKEVTALRKLYPLETEGMDDTVPDRPPFDIRLIVKDDQNNEVTGAFRAASSRDENTRQLREMMQAFEHVRAVSQVSIDVNFDPLWAFAGGTLRRDVRFQGGQPAAGSTPADGALEIPLATDSDVVAHSMAFSLPADAAQGEIAFTFKDWQAQTMFAGPDDPVPTGDLRFVLPITDRRIGMPVVESIIKLGKLPRAAAPCEGDPCDPRRLRGWPEDDCDALGARHLYENGGYDTLSPRPWLHADPIGKSRAGDPKALILGALGGWLMQMLVRERSGGAKEITSARRGLAQRIYRIAWVLLFGLVERTGRGLLGGTLKRLLEAWCSELLWTGPECCGEPHGVVIGTAIVEGGTIQRIDPFAGRRYVVHYPLIEHWGAQFGIAPPDLTASHFFSKLCCLGSLHQVDGDRGQVPIGFISMGGGYLAFGHPREIMASAEKHNIRIAARRHVRAPEMIVSALTMSRPGPSTNREYTALILSELVEEQTVMLLRPA
jgi:hypothetical protein